MPNWSTEPAIKWSYRPYRPFFSNRGDIYISRLVPSQREIFLTYLTEDAAAVTLYCRPRNGEAYRAVGTFSSGEASICGLLPDTEYEFYLEAPDGKRSLTRLARTGDYHFAPINYLHPDDPAYGLSGKYLGSPTLLRLPDGALLASMDVFANHFPQNVTLIYRSEDNGKSWQWQCELCPCLWGKLFLHRGVIYMLSCSTEHGDILLGRSLDGGRSFETPVVLMRGPCDARLPGPDMSPEPPVEYAGRLWINFHWGSWNMKPAIHHASIASVPADADLLTPANWTFSPPCIYDPTWPGTAKGESNGTLEGTFVVLEDQKLYMMARYGITECVPDYGLAVLYKVHTEDPSAPLEFYRTIPFDGNHSKFTVVKDEKSGYYYTIISRITASSMKHARNLLSLMKSADCLQWEVVQDLADYSHLDPVEIGFQYVDFFLEDEDLYFVCRTAIHGAHGYHNANTTLFHILKNFRSL